MTEMVLGGVATLEVDVVFRASAAKELSTRDVVMLGGNEEIERSEPAEEGGNNCWFTQPNPPLSCGGDVVYASALVRGTNCCTGTACVAAGLVIGIVIDPFELTGLRVHDSRGSETGW